MACPFCGYTATHRTEMEQHLALHNQLQDKVRNTWRARGNSITAANGVKKLQYQVFLFM